MLSWSIFLWRKLKLDYRSTSSSATSQLIWLPFLVARWPSVRYVEGFQSELRRHAEAVYFRGPVLIGPLRTLQCTSCAQQMVSRSLTSNTWYVPRTSLSDHRMVFTRCVVRTEPMLRLQLLFEHPPDVLRVERARC